MMAAVIGAVLFGLIVLAPFVRVLVRTLTGVSNRVRPEAVRGDDAESPRVDGSARRADPLPESPVAPQAAPPDGRRETFTFIDDAGNRQEQDLSQFEHARRFLALQLIPEHYDEALRQNMVRWSLAEGFEVMLVLNFGGHESTVRADAIDSWPDRETLYALGLKQGFAAAHAPDFQIFGLAEPRGVDFFSTPTNFIAAFALKALEDTPEAMLFAVPNWCNLLLHEWDGSFGAADVERLQGMVRDLHAQSARPGASGLYFALQGGFERVRFEDGQVVAPPALVERLYHPD
jgi:hypothetical protein